jgi:hypothetical protein
MAFQTVQRALVVFVLLVTLLPMSQSAAQDKLKALQRERVETLTKLASYLEESYKTGATGLEQLLEARQRVAKAELALCETSAERIAVRERVVQEAKEYESRISGTVDAGGRPIGDLLKAKARRLKAEIALEQERSR